MKKTEGAPERTNVVIAEEKYEQKKQVMCDYYEVIYIEDGNRV